MFIPSFHFDSAESKLTPEWCEKVVQYYLRENNLINLLGGKDISEIEGFSNGTYSMKPYKKMFRSLREQMKKQSQSQYYTQQALDDMDKTGINWDRVALIPPKLNSAIATSQKIPIEAAVKCTDPLAQKKKKEDLEFLKHKADMEAEIQPLYDSMNLGKVDMGATKHSSIPYNSLPFDFDVNDEYEFNLFANVIYNLAPEAAFSTILKLYTDIKKVAQVKGLEIRDQYKYAVSCNQVFIDGMTFLPSLEYLYPGTVWTDESLLPDLGDRELTVVDKYLTPMQLFNYFPEEIRTLDDLETLVGTASNTASWDSSYCGCNKRNPVHKNDFNSFKMLIKYVEVKSVDKKMYVEKPNSGAKYFTNNEKEATGALWGQNTYCFFWLNNTKHFFKIDRLPYAYRTKGKEQQQNFSINICRTQEKSAVELSIGENKKAQIADIKLQHNLIMSLPKGKIIDMKYLRNVIKSLKNDEGEGAKQYTIDELLASAMEKNIHLIDTEGFERRNEPTKLAVTDLPGGIGSELEGYYRVMAEADLKISQYTNINQQLTGQSPNPEGLVGLQKLLINSSLNGLFYVNQAIEWQYGPVYTLFANGIKKAVEYGGAPRKAVESIIGTNKVDIIDQLDDVALHQIGLVVKLGQREEERAAFQLEVENMRREGKIDAIGKYYVLSQDDPKDAFLILAMFERKFAKRQERMQEMQMENQQKLVQQQGQNTVANTQAKAEADANLIQIKGQVEAQLQQLANKLGLNQQQLDGLIKRQLQSDRMRGQIEKGIQTIYAKNNIEKQQALPA